MVAGNSDIRTDLHRIADSIAARSDVTTVRDDSAVAGRVGTIRDALLAHYHEGYVEGLHEMAEAVVGYLNSRARPVDRRLTEPSGPVGRSGPDRSPN